MPPLSFSLGTGCHCNRFTTQFTRRKWTGLPLHYVDFYLDANGQLSTILTHGPGSLRFLRMRQQVNGLAVQGLPDEDFTREFSTDCATYGDITTTGITPTPRVGGYVATTPFLDSYVPDGLATGAHEFFNGALVSFTPGALLTVRLKTSASFRVTETETAVFNVDRFFDRAFGDAEMRQVLLHDLAEAKAVTLPPANPGVLYSEPPCGFTDARGGWVASEDFPLIVGTALPSHALLSMSQTAEWNRAQRSTIYPCGNHSLQTRTNVFPDTLLSCENISILDTPYELEPPTVNERRILWVENSRCA